MIRSIDTTEITWYCDRCGTTNTLAMATLLAGTSRVPIDIGSNATVDGNLPKCTGGDHYPVLRRNLGFTHDRMAIAGVHRYLYDQAQIHADQLTWLNDEAAADTDPNNPLRPTAAMRFDPTGDTLEIAPQVKLAVDGRPDPLQVTAYPMDLYAMLACLSISECQEWARGGRIFTIDDDSTIGAFATAVFGAGAERDAFVVEGQRRRLIIAP